MDPLPGVTVESVSASTARVVLVLVVERVASAARVPMVLPVETRA
ncbi:MAG: hypothetical protein ACRDS0_16475 [Pseudonocardiaceae bacterium]